MRWPKWIEGLLIAAGVVAGIAIAYAFNIFLGIAITILAIAIGISRWLQARQPRGPAE